MKKKLTLQDFSDYIVQHEGIAPKDADAFVRAFFDVIEEGLRDDKFVKIKGFGTFKLVSVSERESVNINTGERIQISGHTKVSFTPDTNMKDLVNRPFAHFETVDLNDDTDTKEFEEIDEEMENEEAEETEDENTSEEEVETEEESTTEAESSEATSEVGTVAQEESNDSPAEEEEPNVTSAHNVTDGSTTTEEVVSASPNSISAPTPTTTIADNEEEEENESEDLSAEESLETSQAQSSEDAKGNGEVTEETTNADKENADNEEEIVVTDPTPISTHSSQTDPVGSTSNTLGYTYAEVPSRKKHNWWRTLALTLCVIMLMAGSYFAGYYRILCPECNDIFVTQPIEAIDTTAAQPAPTPVATQPTDSVQKDSAATKAASPTPQEQSEAKPSDDVAQKGANQTQPEAKPTNEAPKEAAKSNEAGEKRPAIYRVKPGDNLSRIAKKYYGDDKYAERIIRHNNLKDANTIHVGMDLRLP